MKFDHPGWLVAGLLACLLLIVLWYRYDARQHKALSRFVSAHLRDALTRSISVGRRRLQRGLFLLALMLLFVALAGPLVGFRWENVNRRGNEIVFAIDTSRSMTTPDMKPDRLTRAKLAIDDFVNALDGDAVGIVAFAGTAFLVCPITLDYGAFHESLNSIDTGTIPRGGTNISSAIHEAQAALRRRPGSDKILILVTDGEDLEGSALATAESAAQEDGLKIYTVGVGTAGGDLIPVPPNQGGGFVKDEGGTFVKSRLDETALKAIATATGGMYVPLGTQGEGLDTIYKTVLGPLAKHDLASRQQKIYIERFQWPLAGSLAALLLSLLVGNRKRRSASSARNPVAPTAAVRTPAAPRPAASRTVASLAPLVILALMGLLTATGVHAQAANVPGTPAAKPTAPAAADTPPDPGAGAIDSKKPIAEYNAGTAAYQAGRFPQAAQAFQRSISHAPSSDAKRLADQEDAYYNLGNTLYRTGQKTEQSSTDDTIKKWNEAVKAYETALQLRPDDADSKYNRDLVKRKIEALKQKKPPQDQDKNKGKGKGQGQGQGQGSGQGQGDGKSPDQNQGGGQPPGQPPEPQQQTAKNGDPKQGQPPQPPPGQQPGRQPGQQAGQPKQSPPNNPDQSADEAAARAADNEHPPGEMSREEARELLDSVKGDEHHALGAPMAQRQDTDDTPDKPFKNW